MTMAEIKIKKWGNSLALIVPKGIVRQEEIDEGDIVKVEIEKEKRVDAFGILKGMPRFERDKDEHEDLW